MNIIFFLQYKKQNDGYDGIVNFINITSRKAYSYVINGKKQFEVNRVFDLFYNEVGTRLLLLHLIMKQVLTKQLKDIQS
jgi:hypothetical protein